MLLEYSSQSKKRQIVKFHLILLVSFWFTFQFNAVLVSINKNRIYSLTNIYTERKRKDVNYETTDLVVTWVSKHASALLAREPVQVLVNQHVIVETVLSRERCVADQTHKRLNTYNILNTIHTIINIIKFVSAPVWIKWLSNYSNIYGDMYMRLASNVVIFACHKTIWCSHHIMSHSWVVNNNDNHNHSAGRRESRREGAREDRQILGSGMRTEEARKVETRVILIVGTVPKGLEKNLRKAGTTVSIELLQKAALLGTARILRKVLDTG